MTTRMKWLVGALVVITVGAAVYFSILLSPPTPEGFNFFGNATSTATLPEAQNAKTPSGTTGTVKKPSGYSITVHGKTETILSSAAGAALDAPVNSVITQDRGVLSVRPPESTQGESIQIQKSTGSFGNALSQIPSLINGTDNGFNQLHGSPDSSDYNPSNVAGPVHIQKLRNRTVAGISAVEVHVTAVSVSGSAPQDFFLIWVHTGATNWYIVRTAAGATPLASAALDTMVGSIQLTP